MNEVNQNLLTELPSEEAFLIHQDRYEPQKNLEWETLFTLCNGYMGVRGSLEEGSYWENPGNFIAGFYSTTDPVMPNQIVNCPNWLRTVFYFDWEFVEEQALHMDECEIVDFKRTLDMKKSMLFRTLTVKDRWGRLTRFDGYRFLSRSNLHRCAMKTLITPLNYSGAMRVENHIDGSMINDKSSSKSKKKYLKLHESSPLPGQGIYLQMKTRLECEHVAIASHAAAFDINRENIVKNTRIVEMDDRIVEYIDFYINENQPVSFEKYVSVYTTRDVPADAIRSKSHEELNGFIADGIDAELSRHKRVYETLWEGAYIRVDGDEKAQNALLYNIYQLMSNAAEYDSHVSIAAKGLHGEGYGGGIFWDTDMYMLPFFTSQWPEAARQLAMYRYHGLSHARDYAAVIGCRGARYPFATDGTGKGFQNYTKFKVNLTDTRDTYLGVSQYHACGAVAYRLNQYYQYTGDTAFMNDCGYEILFEIARFWSTFAQYNERYDRYEFHDVTGPDEFHQVVSNDYHTNYLGRDNIRTAIGYYDELERNNPELLKSICARIELTAEELGRWRDIADRLFIREPNDECVIEQFDGYFDKEDHILTRKNDRGMPMWPAGFHWRRGKHSTIIKQADVILTMWLFNDRFSDEVKKSCYDYYSKRTLHESSLSPCIYALLALTLGIRTDTYRYFMMSALTDLNNNHGNTGQGIHSAALGGTWMVAVNGFAGLAIDQDGLLSLRPNLPEQWSGMSFRTWYRGNQLEIEITGESIRIRHLKGDAGQLSVRLHDRVHPLASGQTIRTPLVGQGSEETVLNR